MDLKFAFAASVLALAGIAAAFSFAGGPVFAAAGMGMHPHSGPRMGWNATNGTYPSPWMGWNATNGTGFPQFAFGRRMGWNGTNATTFGPRGMWNNSAWNAGMNGTGRMRMREKGRMNWTENGSQRMLRNNSMNGTEFLQLRQQFESAVSSGDYATALGLHQSYGFGGRLFDMLNETTFSQYSRLHNTESALWASLGLNRAPATMPHAMRMRRMPSHNSTTAQTAPQKGA